MQDPFNKSETNSRVKRNYFHWLLRFTISALVVTVIVFLVTYVFFKADIFPFQNAESTSEVSENAGNNETTQIAQVTTQEDKAVVNAVEKVSDAVVGVVNYKPSQFLLEPTQSGTGSGVIYKKERDAAYIVTNHHVIDGAQTLEVILNNGDKVEAQLLGSDPLTDLAVLQIDGSKVKSVASFGSSENLKVGETVLTIGNPLGMEFAGSVTQGIISGVERTIPVDLNQDGVSDYETDVLQTDAAINPGNSGGALVNLNGEVIGINSMKIAQQEVEGLGFAIPSSTAKPIVKDLEENGEITRPYLGIQSRDLSTISIRDLQQTLKLPEDVQQGVLVVSSQASSPAQKAGLKPYDVIVKVDDHDITSVVDLRKYLYEEKSVGDEAEVTYYRDGKKQKTTITLSD
ncbi:S1C family serine protease [Pontibacillus litoralis]|uniref:Serine protease n=1 Tax=Pontibacillus litoralis JSM 072002 TaxID=1385512 RepID=A0A0A5HU98_9BACI|nr:trypsin-like peptidase domain-containing protein [Pontibacillus litoralis]KGX87222.1 serine protease [Pontibacillus litoralis JSM 072002]